MIKCRNISLMVGKEWKPNWRAIGRKFQSPFYCLCVRLKRSWLHFLDSSSCSRYIESSLMLHSWLKGQGGGVPIFQGSRAASPLIIFPPFPPKQNFQNMYRWKQSKHSPSLIIFFLASQLVCMGDCDWFSLYKPPKQNTSNHMFCLTTMGIEPATFGILVQCSAIWPTRSSLFELLSAITSPNHPPHSHQSKNCSGQYTLQYHTIPLLLSLLLTGLFISSTIEAHL